MKPLHDGPDLLADLRRGELVYVLRSCGISGKIQRCIVEGPEANEGDWDHTRTDRGQLDHTAIDFAVVATLLERGVSSEDIEAAFARFKIGERYRLHDPAARQTYLTGIIEAVRLRIPLIPVTESEVKASTESN